MKRLSPAEESRITDLLGSLGALEAEVEISGRVSRAVAGRRPGGFHTPTLPQIAAALVGSILAAGAVLASFWGTITLLTGQPVPPLLREIPTFARAVGRLAQACAEALAPLARAALALAEALSFPAEGSQFPLLAATVFSIACLLTLLLATAAFLWRDLRRSVDRSWRVP